MDYYRTRIGLLPGADYRRVYKNAWKVFSNITKKTKRKPYIRSAYFENEKVFFDYFWYHVRQKYPLERARRLRYFLCAIEVIEQSKYRPELKINPNKKSEQLYKFGGTTKSGEIFFVQIKKHVPTNTKQLMSVYPKK